MFGKLRAAQTGSLLILALALGSAAYLTAGGFWLTLGNPAASSDPKAEGAVLIVRPDGCGEPAKATMAGTAEGVINGRRQSVPLKLVALSQPGTYAVHRNWPKEGSWVLSIVGKYQGAVTSAVVPIGPDGFERKAATFAQGQPAKREIEALLKSRSD